MPRLARMGRPPDLLSIAFDSWAMGIQASAVIGLRAVRIAAGGAEAAAEAQLMVTEKIDAAMELQWLAATGALGTDFERAAARSLRHVSRKVRANRRRLGKR